MFTLIDTLPAQARSGLLKAAANLNSNATQRGCDSSIDTNTLAAWLCHPAQQVCAYCGDPSAHTDHIVPLSRGGKHVMANLQRLCAQCNMMKSNLTESEFFGKMGRLLAKKGKSLVWRLLLKVLPASVAPLSTLHRKIASDTGTPLESMCPTSAEKLALGHYQTLVFENNMLKSQVNRMVNREVYSVCTP